MQNAYCRGQQVNHKAIVFPDASEAVHCASVIITIMMVSKC